jgi:hypothetical protein
MNGQGLQVSIESSRRVVGKQEHPGCRLRGLAGVILPEMFVLAGEHCMLLTLCHNTQAIARYGGDKMQTISRVFARVDVVMAAAHREPSSQASDHSTSNRLAHRDVFFVPMISEVSQPDATKSPSQACIS